MLIGPHWSKTRKGFLMRIWRPLQNSRVCLVIDSMTCLSETSWVHLRHVGVEWGAPGFKWDTFGFMWDAPGSTWRAPWVHSRRRSINPYPVNWQVPWPQSWNCTGLPAPLHDVATESDELYFLCIWGVQVSENLRQCFFQASEKSLKETLVWALFL